MRPKMVIVVNNPPLSLSLSLSLSPTLSRRHSHTHTYTNTNTKHTHKHTQTYTNTHKHTHTQTHLISSIYDCEHEWKEWKKKSHATHNEWVMSPIWMRRVTHMTEPLYTFERVVSHIWLSHVTHMNASCHGYDRIALHIWASRNTHLNESCHTSEYVMSHITHKPIWINKSSVNPKSTSNQSSKPCTVLQYPSRKEYTPTVPI